LNYKGYSNIEKDLRECLLLLPSKSATSQKEWAEVPFVIKVIIQVLIRAFLSRTEATWATDTIRSTTAQLSHKNGHNFSHILLSPAFTELQCLLPRGE
jgi:hypothetical protein